MAVIDYYNIIKSWNKEELKEKCCVNIWKPELSWNKEELKAAIIKTPEIAPMLK